MGPDIIAPDGFLAHSHYPKVVGSNLAPATNRNEQLAIIRSLLVFSFGRDDGVAAGEYAGIFYRSSRFSQVDGGHFWLSETPDIPGTVFEGSGAIRMATWVRLCDELANQDFVLLNTRWDHVSQESRELSPALIGERLATIASDVPVIVTGDLNAWPENTAIGILLDAEPEHSPQLIDGYRQANPVMEDHDGTVHYFLGITTGLRIDFVLHDEG